MATAEDKLSTNIEIIEHLMKEVRGASFDVRRRAHKFVADFESEDLAGIILEGTGKGSSIAVAIDRLVSHLARDFDTIDAVLDLSLHVDDAEVAYSELVKLYDKRRSQKR